MVESFEIIIKLFTKIAKSDGVISQEEAHVITASIDDFMTVLSSNKNYSIHDLKLLRKRLVQAHKNAKNSPKPISAYVEKLNYMDTDFKTRVLHKAIVIATIDGYTDLKQAMIFTIGTAFGFSQSQVKQYIDNIVDETLFNPYKILRCKRTDNDMIIKKQYRLLVKKYHPDYLQAKNLDEEFIEFAKQKLQEVTKAYTMIKNERKL